MQKVSMKCCRLYKEFLQGKLKSGFHRVIGQNDLVRVNSDMCLVHELFGNPIISLSMNGVITLCDCGWPTVTTQKRFNDMFQWLFSYAECIKPLNIRPVQSNYILGCKYRRKNDGLYEIRWDDRLHTVSYHKMSRLQLDFCW